MLPNLGNNAHPVSVSICLVLDMIRLVLAFSPVPTQGPSNPNDHVRDALVIAADWQDTTQPQTKPRETNLLLSLRALTNCFQIGPNNTTFGGGNWTIKVRISTAIVAGKCLTTR